MMRQLISSSCIVKLIETILMCLFFPVMKLPDIENMKHLECLYKSKQIILFYVIDYWNKVNEQCCEL